jgi:hypothetical protein
MLKTHLLIGVALFEGLIAGRTSTAGGSGEIFAVSPVYSLRTDGTCQELTAGSFGGLAQSNGHWDAVTKTIKLTAARNEEAAVQLVISKAGKAIGARVSDLTGPATIAAELVEVHANPIAAPL